MNIKHETRCNIIKGEMAELYMRWHLMDKGFKVAKTVIKAVNRKYNKRFAYLNKEEIERYVLRHYNGDKEEIIKIMNSNISGLPDFICLNKEGKICFAEVKSNEAGLRESQVSVINKLKDLGFPVEVKRVNINLEVEEL